MKHFSLLTRAFIVATAIGLAAGALGGVLAALWLVPKILPDAATAPPLRVVEAPGGALAPETLANTVAPAIFALVPKAALRDIGPGAWFAPDAAVGRATALTADGWVVFDAAVPASGLVAVSGDGRTSSLVKIITDPATGLAFAHLPLAELPSLSFSRRGPPRSGELVYAVLGRRHAATVVVAESQTVAAIRPEEAVTSSETLDRRATVLVALGKGSRGSPVFDGSGALAGIVIGERGDRFVRISQFETILPELFKTGAVHRPYLGVRSIDMSLLAANSADVRRGAALVDISGRPAVRAGSPAAAVGFKSGDVIIEIENEALAPGETVAEALQEYRPGDRVSFTVQRGTERVTLTAELGDTANMR